jgi:hypothetical protein
MAMQRNLKPWQVSMYCGTVGELDRGIGGDNDVPIDQLIGRERSRILVYHTMLCLVLGTRKHQAYQMLLEANVKLVENRSWDDSFIKPEAALALETEGEAVLVPEQGANMGGSVGRCRIGVKCNAVSGLFLGRGLVLSVEKCRIRCEVLPANWRGLGLSARTKRPHRTL